MSSSKPSNRRPQPQTYRLPATEVRVGMRVVALDRPWLGTPFLLQGFDVRSQEELDELCTLCDWVEVQVLGTPGSAVRSRPRPRVERIQRQRAYADSIPAAEEFKTAEPLYLRGIEAARALYLSAAEARPLDLESVRVTVSQCVQSVVRNPGPLQLLSQLRDRDQYTAEHSFNVATLAISFGRHLGLAERHLHRLGAAALLHDIGKMRTPLNILNKPGPLDPDEAKIMRAHAREGFELLSDTAGIPGLVREVAHSHHEAPDGSGYPQQLRIDAVSDFTSMVTLCDVYDAITAHRIYKPARPSIDALRVIHDLRGKKFHQELAIEFIRHLGPYPLGCLVELHNDEIAIVTGRSDMRHLPDVLIILGADKHPIEPRPTRLTNAAQSLSKRRLIKRVLPNGAHGVNLENYLPTLTGLLGGAL